MPAKSKGHWPAGKRRNADRGDWEIVRLGLSSLLDHYELRGVISLRALAKAIGVDPRQATRYLRGEDRPTEETQETAATWLKEVRAIVKRTKWE